MLRRRIRGSSIRAERSRSIDRPEREGPALARLLRAGDPKRFEPGKAACRSPIRQYPANRERGDLSSFPAGHATRHGPAGPRQCRGRLADRSSRSTKHRSRPPRERGPMRPIGRSSDCALPRNRSAHPGSRRESVPPSRWHPATSGLLPPARPRTSRSLGSPANPSAFPLPSKPFGE